MAAQASPWRAGIIDLNPAGLYLLECMGLSPNVQMAGTFDSRPERLALANHLQSPVWTTLSQAVQSTETDVLFFMGCVSADILTEALSRGKHVVIHQPWRLSAAELGRLASHARSLRRSALTTCFRRSSIDFRLATAVLSSGRLGTLSVVRCSSCETTVAQQPDFAGALREYGYDWLDQLRQLVNSAPNQILARRFIRPGGLTEHGIWVMIEFADGCLAQLDIQTQSRLSLRTGWMLEGSTGSYRNDRLYTQTADGEIVDELLPGLQQNAEPPASVILFDEFIKAWQNEPTTLPTFSNAAETLELLQAIEGAATHSSTK